MKVLSITLAFLFSICVKAQDQSCVSLFQQSQVELSDEVTDGLYKLAEDQVRTQKLPMSESKNMILREIKRQVFEKANEFDNPDIVLSFYRNVISEISQASRESTESIQARNENRKHKNEILKQQKKLQKVEELKIKYKNENLEEIFILAVEKGEIENVKLLIEEGINIETKGADRLTALHISAGNGNIDIVRLLLEEGINKNARDLHNNTALHLATKNGYVEVVRLLLEAGIKKDIKNIKKRTALEWSIIFGHIEIMKLLLEAEVNIKTQINSRDEALVIAKIYRNHGMVQFLEEAIEKQKRDSPGLIDRFKNWWSR